MRNTVRSFEPRAVSGSRPISRDVCISLPADQINKISALGFDFDAAVSIAIQEFLDYHEFLSPTKTPALTGAKKLRP